MQPIYRVYIKDVSTLSAAGVAAETVLVCQLRQSPKWTFECAGSVAPTWPPTAPLLCPRLWPQLCPFEATADLSPLTPISSAIDSSEAETFWVFSLSN